MGAYENELLNLAPALTRTKLSGKVRRLRELRHLESMKTRRAKAAADRCVYVRPDRDGMAWLNTYLPAENAIAAFNRIDTAAKTLQNPAEARTLTQLRAGVLAALLIHTGGQTNTSGPDSNDGSNGQRAGQSGNDNSDAATTGASGGRVLQSTAGCRSIEIYIRKLSCSHRY